MFDFIDIGFDEPSEPLGSGPYIPDAAECMRCGLCVSHCPTFRLFQVDEETPRRRLRTISKLIVENQPVTAEERLHLDNCLQCRACETICPSRVAYGQLFDQAQALLKTNPGLPAKLAFKLIENKRWRNKLLPLLSIYLASGLQKPLRQSGLLKKLHLADAEALLTQPVLPALALSYSERGFKRGRVALFTGCIAEHFDRETLLAAIKLLNAIGYEVLVPPEQGCCGAMHQHNGQPANVLTSNNIDVFNALEVDAVLFAASGCGAMLTEYQTDDAAGQRFRQRLCDINDFLLKHWPDDLQLTASTLKVAVHEPCSRRNVLKNQQSVNELLNKIPGLHISALADNSICCGAGGSYMLTRPDNAKRLKALKQQAIAESSTDLVVSGNFACRAFLNCDRGRVVDLLQLLAKQLPVS
jgi:glycolate oxidase iron-sulfur subunit